MIMEEPLLIYKKKELRKKMLALRRALSTDETDKMAMCLRANIVSLPQYKKANRIMAFLAMRGESNLDPLIEQALADEKEIYIPVCLPERQMGAGRLFSMSGFTKGPLGLRNLPAPYTMIAPEDLDLVLVPAVACGVDGTRLGMGAGYYDRYLERVSPEKRVSVLWDFQVMDSVPNGIYEEGKLAPHGKIAAVFCRYWCNYRHFCRIHRMVSRKYTAGARSSGRDAYYYAGGRY